MKNKYRFLKILVTIIILGFLLNFSLKRFNDASLKSVVINMIYPKGEDKVYFIDEKNVKDFISKTNPSQKVGSLDVPELEREVNFFPSVDSANVYLGLNGVLNVEIQQRVPVFRLKKGVSEFYVDTKNEEFPISKIYSHPTILVMGNVSRAEYPEVANLVRVINKDNFCRKFFVGITKEGNSYNLLTADGDYKVELGSLENIAFKIKGFKTFVEKILVYQPPKKYSKISVKYDNQIVTTLNENFREEEVKKEP